MAETFVPKLSVIDEWTTTACEEYRLVNLGAGPDLLQVKRDGKWVQESPQYRWSTLCNRIAELSKKD